MDRDCVGYFKNFTKYVSIFLTILLGAITLYIYKYNVSFKQLNIYIYLIYHILFSFVTLSYWIYYILYRVLKVDNKYQLEIKL